MLAALARLKSVTASTDVADAKNLVDDDPATQWVSDSRQALAEIDLGAESAPADQWTTIESGTSIGSTYSKKFPAVTARYVRLKINDSGALLRFSEIQLYE